MSRFLKMSLLISLGLAFSRPVLAENTPEKIRKLVDEMKSDNVELSQVATMELASAGEEGLRILDDLVRLSAGQGEEYDKLWEAFKGISEIVRKKTLVSMKSNEVMGGYILSKLSRQTGLIIGSHSLVNKKTRIDVTDAPFWDVMNLLASQWNMKCYQLENGEYDYSNNDHLGKSSKIAGDWVMVDQIERNKEVDYLTGEKTENSIKLQIRVHLDPLRCLLFSRGEIRIDKAVDDAGGIYAQQPFKDRQYGVFRNHLVGPVMLSAKSVPGKKLTIQGVATFWGGETQVKKFDYKPELIGKILDVGVGKVKVLDLSRERTPSFSLGFKYEDWAIKGPTDIDWFINPLLRGCVWVEDDQGNRQMFSVDGPTFPEIRMKFEPRNMVVWRSSTFNKPEKLVFAMPHELAPIVIPFEIKDIPMP